MDWFVFVFLVFFVAMPWSILRLLRLLCLLWRLCGLAVRKLEGRSPLSRVGRYFGAGAPAPSGAR